MDEVAPCCIAANNLSASCHDDRTSRKNTELNLIEPLGAKNAVKNRDALKLGSIAA